MLKTSPRTIYSEISENPNEKTRLEILKVHTEKMPLKNVKLSEIAKKTEGYVGADLEAVCREAAILALIKDMKSKEIIAKEFDDALEKVRPSATKEIKQAYEEIKEHFKSARGKEMKDDKPSYYG